MTEPLPATRQCGWGFRDGFSDYLSSGEFADVTVVAPRGQEYRCHALLLACHSEFFRRALLCTGLREGAERRVQLRFDDPADVWPELLKYFYEGRMTISEQNAMGLLNLAKRLVVGEVEAAARDFIKERLTPANCVEFLRQAVQCEDVELQEECTRLAALGFHTTHSSDVTGFPPHVILDILTHPSLEVQCEEQVLVFVLRYVHSTQLPPEDCRQLFAQVRFAYLPNRRYAELQSDHCVPRDFLAEGALARLALMTRAAEGHAMPAPPAPGQGGPAPGAPAREDSASMMHWVVQHASPLERLDSGASGSINGGGEGGFEAAESPRGSEGTPRSPPGPSCSAGSQPCSPAGGRPAPLASPSQLPRPSYCSSLEHGLPGGRRYVDLPCEHVWQALAQHMHITVSGVSEGRPRNVLSEDPDAFFSTNEGGVGMAPWVEIHLPPNVALLSLTHYRFLHGHVRTSYYKMRSWKTQLGSASCTVPGSTFEDLDTKWESCLDVLARKGSSREHFTVTVFGAGRAPAGEGWRVVRLVSTGSQQDGVRRLCLKGLRLYGLVRVDLLRQGEGMLMSRELLERALAECGNPAG